MTDKFLPYGRQLIEADDVAAVEAVLLSDYLTSGPTVDSFEGAFAERVAAEFVVCCSSGTAALHLAAIALGLDTNDAVVVPAITFLATANCARYVGAEVVFADVDRATGLMTPATLEAALAAARQSGQIVRAVFPVHLNGQCADMAAIAEIAEQHDLAVVEDACHMLGGAYDSVVPEGKESPVGNCQFADMNVFSLHPVKVIAMGEGGIITTNDSGILERLVNARNHGMVRAPEAFQHRQEGFDKSGNPNPWYYEMAEPGFNYRASDIHCALGLSQLRKLDCFVRARDVLVAAYDKQIAELAPVIRPIGRASPCRPAWHLYVVQIDFATLGLERGDMMRRLRAAGIGTQVHYIPLYKQPYYRNRYGDMSMPGAEGYYASALSLPLFVGMNESDVSRVVGALTEICRA